MVKKATIGDVKAIHTIVDDDNDNVQFILYSRCEFLPCHEKTAIARKTYYWPIRIKRLRCDRRRRTIAHGTCGGRKLRTKGSILKKAMNPRRIVPRPICYG